MWPTMPPARRSCGCAADSSGRRSTTSRSRTRYYYYQAKRNWIDSETYAFDNATSTIDRDRFFVTHNQHIVGNNADLAWDIANFRSAEPLRRPASGEQQLDHVHRGGQSESLIPPTSVTVVDSGPWTLRRGISPDIRNSRLDRGRRDRSKIVSSSHRLWR